MLRRRETETVDGVRPGMKPLLEGDGGCVEEVAFDGVRRALFIVLWYDDWLYDVFDDGADS